MKTSTYLLAAAFFIITLAGASASLSTNLVSYWKADNAYTDSTGFETLTEVGGVTFNTGIINQSFDLDGTNDYIRSNTRTWGVTNNWTYSFWVYRDTTTAATFLRFNQTSGNANIIAAETLFGTSLRTIVFDSAGTFRKDYRTTTTPLNSGAWYHIVISYGDDLQIYINGVLQSVNATINTTGSMTDGSRRLHLGSEVTGQFHNGRIDEIGFWSTTLTASQVSQLYNGGAGQSYPFPGTSLTITAIDNYNSTAITTFNATVTFNGTTTTYTTTNGTIPTGLLVNSSQTANITVTAPQYFANVTTNHSSVGLQAGLFPWTVVRARDQYNSTNITSFTVSYNGTDYTTTNGFVYVPYISNTLTTTITVNSPSWYFTNTTTPTGSPYLSGLNATIYPHTAIRAQSFTGTNISNFTLTFNSTNYSTTTGIIYIPLYNGTYEVQITNAQQGSTIYANSALNLTGNPYLQNQTFTLYTYNSIRIFVRSETTANLLSGTNVTINTNGETTARTNTTSNGTLYIDNLPDGTYSIIFSATGYGNKLYTVTVANYSSQELNAYLSNSSTTTTFNLEAANGPEAGQPIEGAIVTFETYINGSYVVVESRLSDVSGTAGPFTYTTSNPYRVTIDADNFVTKQFLLNPVQYSTYDIFLTSTTSFTNAQDYEGISIVFTPSNYYNSAQNNFTFIISSPNGTLTSYNYTITYPSGTVTNSGVNSYGSTLTSAFNITGATISSTVELAYCYTTSETGLRCFTRSYPVIVQYSNYTLAGKGAASNMGDLEKILLATIGTAVVTGMATLAVGPIGAGVIYIFSLGLFYKLLAFNIWLLLIPAFVGFIIIAFGSRNQ